MPNWKKLIVSGSDASLNSLNATAALTASGLIYPSSDGFSGQVISTDGNGNLSFSTVSGGGTALTISGSSAGGTQVSSNNFTKLQFDSDTGLNLDSIDSGATALISIGSHYKDIIVDGQVTLVATGSDQLELISGTGINITTSTTDTNSNSVSKELAFEVDNTIATTGSNSFVGDQDITGALTASSVQLLNLGDTNEIVLVGSNQGLTSSGVLSIDPVNNYVGINQTSPEVTLHMTGEGAQTAQIRMEQYNDNVDAPDTRTRRYRGTIDSPSAVQTGDYLYRSNHEFWNGTSLIVGGQFAFDNTNNANRTQFTIGVTTDGTSVEAGSNDDIQFKIDGNDGGAITFNDAYKFPTTDGADGQVLTTDGAGNLTFATVEDVYVTVKNVSGGELQKGTPVHATSSQSSGNATPVIAASASDASTMPATFVLNETLADEAEGQALLSGYLQGVDTSLFETGEVVYVGENGGFTNVKPTGSTNLIQNLGIVTKIHASNGSGWVYGSGRSNDVPNLPEGKVWVGSSTYSVTSSLVHLDESNGRLGLGNTAPSNELTVEGSISASGDFHINNNQGLVSKNVAGADRTLIELDNTNTLRIKGNDSEGSANAITMVAGGDVNFPADVTVQGTLTAQEFHTEYVSASIIYESGSTKFGDTSDDIHNFTGSVIISGSTDLTLAGGTGNATFNVTDAGDLTIAADDDIRLDAGGNDIAYRFNGTELGRMSSANSSTDLQLTTSQTNGDILLLPNGSGNVGIGTTDPVAKFNVVDGTTNLYFSGSLGNGFRGLNLAGTNPSVRLDGGGDTFIISALNSSLGIWDETASNYRVNILNNGNVGIGTTSPTKKLQVDGEISGSDVYINDWGSVSASLATITGNDLDGSGTTSYIPKWSDSDTLTDSNITDDGTTITLDSTLYVTQSRVGIGTTDPGQKLEVVGNAEISGRVDASQVRIKGNERLLVLTKTINTDSHIVMKISGEGYNDGFISSNYNNIGIGGVNGYSAGNLNININNGYVGIGVKNPSDKLHVKRGTLRIETGDIQFYNNANYRGKINTEDGHFTLNGLNNITFEVNDSIVGRWGSNGHFGIGTPDPDFPLDINTSDAKARIWNTSGSPSLELRGGNGQILFKGASGTEDFLMINRDNSFAFKKTSAGQDYMVFSTSGSNEGNVGIGTDSPSAKLDVEGDVLIKAANLSNQENTDVDTGTEVVATVAIATYTAAFFDFVIKNGTNVRSGTVFACHDGTNVEFTETSTADLGNTSPLTLSVDISAGNMRLLATATTDNWSVKSLIRAL